ncbi:MAG: GNAT family N-acetyltransferase [Xanthobacteraceae bacterium]
MTFAEEVFSPARRERTIAVLETERLVLRAPRPEDAEAMARLISDRRIAVNTARIPYPYGVEDAEQFIAAVNGQDGEVAFLITFDGALIGGCGVAQSDSGPELGYWVGVPFWGQGFATEAARAIIDHAFGSLGHEVLEAGARVSNPASRRVLEKCGFQWTGVRLARVRAINSAAPADRFRLDRRLWESLKTLGRTIRVV